MNENTLKTLGMIALLFLVIMLVAHVGNPKFMSDFISAIVWPLAAVAIVYILRGPIGNVLERFAGGAKAAPSATPPAPQQAANANSESSASTPAN